jgi:hypothetical protein
MIVITQQSWVAGHKILNGTYNPSIEQALNFHKNIFFEGTLIRSYKWMQEQYALKYNVDPNTYLLWGWTSKSINYSYERMTKRKLKGNIIFELEVENVLVSCFDKWHNVLNNHCVYPKYMDKLSYDEFETLAAEYDKTVVKEKTWLSVFENINPANEQVVFPANCIKRIVRWNCGQGWKYK